MAIPNGYDFSTWFNKIIDDLSQINIKLGYFREDWDSFPSTIKNGIKTKTSNIIDITVDRLKDFKLDINNL